MERDFLVLTSALRFVILRWLVVLLLAALVVTVLHTMDVQAGRSRRSPDEVGRALFSVFAVAYPVLVVLVGPALAAGAIAGERALDTLSLVLAAPVRPSALVLAKFLSRLGALLVPLVGGLPIAAISFLYGGISSSLFVDWLLVVLGLAVMATAASVVASAYARTVASAVLAAYLLGVVIPVLETFLAGWVHFKYFSSSTPSWVFGHSPGAAVGVVWTGAIGTGVAKADVYPFLAVVGACAVVALVLATQRLGREAQASAATGPRRGSTKRTLFQNPVLDRACRALPLRSRAFGPWIGLIVVATLTALPLALNGSGESVLAGLQVCLWTTAFILLARASQCVAAERQQGSLALLLATRLGSAEIISGKVLGLLVQGAVLLLPGVVLCVEGTRRGLVGAATLPCWLVACAIVLFLVTSTGVWLSSRASTAGKAAVLAFGWTIGAMVGHGLLVAGIMLVVRNSDAVLPVGAASPPFLAFFVTSACAEQGGYSEERKLLAWCVFWGVAYVVASLLMLQAAQRSVEESSE